MGDAEIMISEEKLDPKEKIVLKPNPKCKYCLGRGYIRTIVPELNAEKFRVLRPCSCVKAIVELRKITPGKMAEQKIIR